MNMKWHSAWYSRFMNSIHETYDVRLICHLKFMNSFQHFINMKWLISWLYDCTYIVYCNCFIITDMLMLLYAIRYVAVHEGDITRTNSTQSLSVMNCAFSYWETFPEHFVIISLGKSLFCLWSVYCMIVMIINLCTDIIMYTHTHTHTHAHARYVKYIRSRREVSIKMIRFWCY